MSTSPLDINELLEEYGAMVNRLTRAYAYSSEEQADLRQEAAVALWKAASSFKGQAKVSTWVYRVVINVCISHVRQQSRRREHLEAFGQEQQAQAAAHDATEEQINQLYAAVRRLSPADKAVVTLYLEDRSYAEMADILGLTVSNVGVKLNRAKARLKELIDG